MSKTSTVYHHSPVHLDEDGTVMVERKKHVEKVLSARQQLTVGSKGEKHQENDNIAKSCALGTIEECK